MAHFWLFTLSALAALLIAASPVVRPPRVSAPLPEGTPAPAAPAAVGWVESDPVAGTPAGATSPARPAAPPGIALPTRALTTGTINTLVILVDFSDNPRTVDASFFDSLLFAPPAPGRGSLRDYFHEVSYGAVNLATQERNLPSIMGWQRAPEAYRVYVSRGYCLGTYPNNCLKLAEEMLDALDSEINFSDYDNDGDGVVESVMLVHAGPGAEFTGRDIHIQSHLGTFSPPRTYDGVKVERYAVGPEYWFSSGPQTSDISIGVYAKLLAQQVWRLPDLADRDRTSHGAGRWSLLGSGWSNGATGLGDSPAWPDAWSRVQMGFVTPKQITVTGDITVTQAAGVVPDGTVFQIRSEGMRAGEYFLLENRQKAEGSYDGYLPGSGLLIWHVDEAMLATANDAECLTAPDSTCQEAHFLAALEQADGRRELEKPVADGNAGDPGDPFPGTSTNREFTAGSVPGVGSYYSDATLDLGVVSIGDSGIAMTACVEFGPVKCPPVEWPPVEPPPVDPPPVVWDHQIFLPVAPVPVVWDHRIFLPVALLR